MTKRVALALIFTLCVCLGLCACAPSGDTTARGSITGSETYKDMLQARLPAKGEEICVITTNYGTMKMMFFDDYAPKAVENFKTHARDGYYNDTFSHRLCTDFMMQAGDPTGTGRGGESIWGTPFEDEITPSLCMVRGAVAMANAGSNSNGSQFFIVQGGNGYDIVSEVYDEYMALYKQQYGFDEAYAAPFVESSVRSYFLAQYGSAYETVTNALKQYGGAPWLQGKHTIFGQVFEGLDVLDRIMEAAATESGVPAATVRLLTVEIVPYEGD